jgi:diguanylate cyclase (GGDEF)-like protein/PAS domain S-box-containing protein
LQSIKTRATVLTLILSIVSTWFIIIFVVGILREDMQRQSGIQQLSTVSLLANEINHEIKERLQSLEIVAGDLVKNTNGDPRKQQVYLESLSTLRDHFNGGVSILDAGGTVVADVPIKANRVGLNFMDSEVTASTIRSGVSSISPPILGKAAKAPVIVMVVPVFDAKGHITGAISGVINLAQSSFFDLISTSHYGHTGDFVLVAPKHGLIVTSSVKGRRIQTLQVVGSSPMIDRFNQGFEGSVVGLDAKGVEVLSSVKTVPVTGWYVAASLPTTEAFAPIRDRQVQLLIITLLLTAMSGVAIWWMLRRQLSPLLATVSTLSRLTTEQLPLASLPIVRNDEIGQLIGAFNGLLHTVNGRDIALRESEQRHRLLVEWSPGAVAVHRNGIIVYVNPVAVRLFGAKSANELVGRHALEFVVPDYHAVVIARMKSTISTGVASPMIEEKYCKFDGSTLMDLEVQTRQIVFDGQPSVYVAMHDITARKQAQLQIETLAFFDPLTGLPNRRLLVDRLEQALASSSRHSREGALLFIDLDNFKDLNDTLGHDKGDLLLQQVGQRLSSCMRDGDTVARFGGDEFVIILQDLSEVGHDAVKQVQVVAEKIRLLLGQPYFLVGYEHHSTPSIGATLFGNSAESVAEILRRADLAMYQSKMEGRNTLRFFDPKMQTNVIERSNMEGDIHRALVADQFSLYFQPQVNSHDQLLGAEALLRWNHPERGIISPTDFISLAEDTRLILPIGKWVLQAACEQLFIWSTQPGMHDLSLSVNISARQFHQNDFVSQVLSIIQNSGANPQLLKFELTESLLLTNVEDVIAKMVILKEYGIGFSLDDFGTGYSSLSYLKRLPLDQLKIDQAFVRDILLDPDDAAIARMVVSLAQSLELQVMAEGVETVTQRKFLQDIGCHAYQGYLFSRPLQSSEFDDFVNARLRSKSIDSIALM